MNLRAWRTRWVFKQFPELAEISPTDQQGVLNRATARATRRSALASSAGALGAVIPGLVAGFFAGSFVSIAVGVLAQWMPGAGLEIVAMVAGLLAFAITTSLAVIVAVHWIETNAIRREIRAQLNRAECVKCGYSLAGLTPTEGRVTCPECGLNVAVQVFAWKSASDTRLHPPTEATNKPTIDQANSPETLNP